MKGFSTILIVIIVMSTPTVFGGNLRNILDSISFDVPEDANLGFIEIVNKYGFQCEKYQVVTEDGYILTLFHIIAKCSGPPVFLMHGLLDSSDSFVIRGNESMGITLANECYDVWLGNMRGNKYCRKHIILDPDRDRRFWYYGIDEFGSKDLPALIDFVLDKTGYCSLQAIAHSEGTTAFFVLGFTRPEYNRKVKLFIALAPAEYVNHVKGLFYLVLKAGPVLNAALKAIHVEELLPNSTAIGPFLEFICSNGVVSTVLCETGLVGPVVGYDNEEYHDFLSIGFGHFPSGTSRQNFHQLVQTFYRRKLAKYDYGAKENLRRYNSVEPPVYNFSNVTMNIALLVGRNDFIANIPDSMALRDELPNVVYYKIIDRKKMDHIDFVWGKNMKVYLFPIVLDLLKTYD